MRNQFCDAMVARSGATPGMLFLTGDLGFMALEPLQAAMGRRFINAGVAEQNMVSVSAGLARQGFEVWVYSIAPFCYARPFEQIRNDVAFHGLPVRLVGNGGGYGYGVMGPTHHAIEDYGVLLTLPGLRAFVPVFDEDVPEAVARAAACPQASYLRLGRGEKPAGHAAPAYAPWRCLVPGRGPLLIAVGPLAGSYIGPLLALPESSRPSLWALAELPIDRHPMPPELQAALAAAPVVGVAEEHVRRGGVGAELALHLVEAGLAPRRFVHAFATAHHFARYGSQAYMRRQSGLDAASVLAALGSPP